MYLNVNQPEWIFHRCQAKCLPTAFPTKWLNNEEKDWNDFCKCKHPRIHVCVAWWITIVIVWQVILCYKQGARYWQRSFKIPTFRVTLTTIEENPTNPYSHYIEQHHNTTLATIPICFTRQLVKYTCTIIWLFYYCLCFNSLDTCMLDSKTCNDHTCCY